MAFKKQDSAGYLLNHLARLFAAGLGKKIKPLGIVRGQFPALLELWEEDGLTQKELVVRLDIEQATMANTLGRMERAGLIVRKAHPNDGRSSQVWLTKQGRSLESKAVAAANAVNASALATLSKSEHVHLTDMLRRILATFDEGSAD